MFVESRETHHTSQATMRPAVVAIMRLPPATSSRVWQCGHSIPSESAITRAAGTVFPQCGHIRFATIHLAKSTQRYRNRPRRKSTESRNQREFHAAAHGIDTFGADAHTIAEFPNAHVAAPARDDGMIPLAV